MFRKCNHAARLLLVLCGLAPSLALSADEPPGPATSTEQRVERFDVDPRWDAANNRVEVKPNPVVQDFGFTRSRHAQGRHAGEIGGRIQRCTTPAYYGKRLEAAKTFDDRLHVSGR